MTARIFSLFLALLTLANLVGDRLRPGFDANIWWISFGRSLPVWLSQIVLAVAALALLIFAFRANRFPRRSPVVAGSALLLALVAAVNAIGFYRLLLAREIEAAFPLPLSLFIALGLLVVARAAWRRERTEFPVRRGRVVAGATLLFALFPLALMLCFGNTDYRRPADAVVVFGARAYADGRLSNALADRMRTACELYRGGLAKQLVLSGGPGDGAVTEAEAMRRYALSRGVRAEDIVIDNQGLNTDATVRNTAPLLRQWPARRVLVVSHFYHLPRIKLAYQRAGVEVCTVPAPQGHLQGKLPFYLAREAAAFWAYYWKEKPGKNL